MMLQYVSILNNSCFNAVQKLSIRGSFRVKSTNFLPISGSTILDFDEIFTECALIRTCCAKFCSNILSIPFLAEF